MAGVAPVLELFAGALWYIETGCEDVRGVWHSLGPLTSARTFLRESQQVSADVFRVVLPSWG